MTTVRMFSAMLCLLIFSGEAFAYKMKCKVKGKINGVEKAGEILILRKVGEFESITVAKGKLDANGTFSIQLPDSLNNEMLELQVAGTRTTIFFVAEKGTVTIEADKNNLFMGSVVGTPGNKAWTDYRKYVNSVNDNRHQLMSQKLSAEEKKAKFDEVNKLLGNYVDSLIQHHPSSVVSLYLAKVPLPMLKYTRIDSLLENFKPYFAQHPYFLEMKERADILRKVAPGAIAPGFTAVQADGKTPISLSSFRGKYVMLDFWASWCLPCREENKHTKELYSKFNPLGLEIISFSLDSDLKAWQQAIEKDGLPWQHASDLVGGKKSPVATEYGIDGIPAIWIIDPQGKIIAEGVRGEALSKLLTSIFIK